MSKKGLSRRNFLKLSGSAAAFAAFQTQFPTLASAASLQQDVITISFAGWGGTPEQEGVSAAIAVFEQEIPEFGSSGVIRLIMSSRGYSCRMSRRGRRVIQALLCPMHMRPSVRKAC
jgi:hypothetical protein